MAATNPAKTKGGRDIPAMVYLENLSRTRRAIARGPRGHHRGIVLQGGIRIPTQSRLKGITARVLVDNLAFIIGLVSEGNLRVYRDAQKQSEVELGDLVILSKDSAARKMLYSLRPSSPTTPSTVLKKDPAQIQKDREAEERQLAQLHQEADNYELKAAAIREQALSQERWLEFRAIMDADEPDLDAAWAVLDTADDDRWFKAACEELREHEEAQVDVPEPEPAPQEEPSGEDGPDGSQAPQEPNGGEGANGWDENASSEPQALQEPQTEEQPTPPPSEEAEISEPAEEPQAPLKALSLDELKSLSREELEATAVEYGINDADDSSKYRDIKELAEVTFVAAGGEAPYSESELKSMRRDDLESLAFRFGIETPSDRDNYPNIPALAAAVALRMSKTAPQGGED